jgi:hypothetical protein
MLDWSHKREREIEMQLTTYRLDIAVETGTSASKTHRRNLTATGVEAVKAKIRAAVPMGSIITFKVTEQPW